MEGFCEGFVCPIRVRVRVWARARGGGRAAGVSDGCQMGIRWVSDECQIGVRWARGGGRASGEDTS